MPRVRLQNSIRKCEFRVNWGFAAYNKTMPFCSGFWSFRKCSSACEADLSLNTYHLPHHVPLTAPISIVQNQQQRITELFQKNVVPSYGRFELVLERGAGSYIWDVNGRRYLDLTAGIAVCCLGHAHPEITQALTDQAQKLIHISNLYYT